MSDKLNNPDTPVSVLHRNAVTRCPNLNELNGEGFEIQGIRFLGKQECRRIIG